MKKATDLTENEREIFVSEFYKISLIDDRYDNPVPWGCPWFYDQDLVGTTVAEMATELWERHKVEILDLVREQDEARE